MGTAGSRRVELALVAAALGSILFVPLRASAQDYTLTVRSGRQIELSRSELIRMHDTTVALQENLDLDPEVLYWWTFGPDAPADSAGLALPWEAIEVVTDSTVALTYPGNLREADRAYNNYAVLRMRAVRNDPDVGCETVFDRELQAVDLFVDGWIVSRTLFGGPPYEPLDELVFARAAGHLSGLIAAHDNPQLGGCLPIWREANPKAAAEYRTWRRDVFRARPEP